MSIIKGIDLLNQLRQNLITNLSTKGITSIETEGFETLIPKVSDIPFSGVLSHFTIPAGRLAGDINGDGRLSGEDVQYIYWYAGGMTDEVLNEYDKKLYDISNDTKITIQDSNRIHRAANGNARYANVTRDIDGKWLINPNYETEKAQFYTDIEMNGLTSITDLKIYRNKIDDILVRAEYVSDGILRLFVLRPPISDIVYDVVMTKGTGIITTITSTRHIDIFSGVIDASSGQGTSSISLKQGYGQYVIVYEIGTDSSITAPPPQSFKSS